jgi:TrmH family RNA methyltransferase
MKRIESRNNPIIKSMAALRFRRDREEQRLFFFEGVHLLEEFVRSGRSPKWLFVREDVSEKYAALIEKADCEVYEVTESVYDKLTEEKAPQGIFTVSDFLDNVVFLDDTSVASLPSMINGNSVMLCDLQDNGNVGTVIRTAAAMGCDVILCGRCADVYSPKTVRATMGAIFMNGVYVCPSAESAIRAFRNANKRVIATALTENARTLGEFEINPTDCFVIGNEGKGLTDSVIGECDFTAIIPMSGRTESLNAASASSMILWEARRGRRF